MDDTGKTPEDLLTYPCDFIFKAFGPDEETFVSAVRDAVSTVLPVPLDAMKRRASAKGTYVCVSVVVHLHNADQLRRIYAELRKIESLKYLL